MDLVLLSQAAKELGLSRARIYQLADGGQIKTIEVLGRKGIKRTELERFKLLDRPAHRPKKATTA